MHRGVRPAKGDRPGRRRNGGGGFRGETDRRREEVVVRRLFGHRHAKEVPIGRHVRLAQFSAVRLFLSSEHYVLAQVFLGHPDTGPDAGGVRCARMTFLRSNNCAKSAGGSAPRRSPRGLWLWKLRTGWGLSRGGTRRCQVSIRTGGFSDKGWSRLANLKSARTTLNGIHRLKKTTGCPRPF